MTLPKVTRRDALALVAALAGLRRAGAQEASDRGIGGTGAAPPDPEDRGIGGTGVMGTIRRFGSVVVNDLRIAYPKQVSVTLDGQPADVRALRIGHVVRVLAEPGRAGLATTAIAVSREVVGPVEAVWADGLTVLGQQVSTAEIVRHRWRVGQRVAVSGLRRPDGIVVASLIEKAGRSSYRLVGPVLAGPRGDFTLGGLPVTGFDPALAERRVILTGDLREGRFVVGAAELERDALLRLATRQFTIETYLQRTGQTLRAGADLVVPDGSQAFQSLADNETVRAVVTATATGADFAIQSIRVETSGRSQGRGGPGMEGRDHGLGPGSKSAPDGSGSSPGPGRRDAAGSGRGGPPSRGGASGGPGGGSPGGRGGGGPR